MATSFRLNVTVTGSILWASVTRPDGSESDPVPLVETAKIAAKWIALQTAGAEASAWWGDELAAEQQDPRSGGGEE